MKGPKRGWRVGPRKNQDKEQKDVGVLKNYIIPWICIYSRIWRGSFRSDYISRGL